MEKKIFDRIEFKKGLSSKNNRVYYRIDIYFKTVNNKVYRKCLFLTVKEVNILGLKDIFQEVK